MEDQFERSLVAWQHVLGESETRQALLETLVAGPRRTDSWRHLGMFKRFAGTPPGRKAAATRIVQEFVQQSSTSPQDQVLATFMEPARPGWRSHFVGAVLYPKENKLVMFQTRRRVLARDTPYLWQALQRHTNWEILVVHPNPAVQLTTDDVFCQTWSLLFLVFAIGKSSTDLVTCAHSEYGFGDDLARRREYLSDKIRWFLRALGHIPELDALRTDLLGERLL